jgi:hypothetical protein|tara:strand:- start:17242 stop:17901 length:660 start_codon:yes stop_codon:yes gene_type:complete
MPTYDFACARGHVFDGIYAQDETLIPCRSCRGEASISDFYPETSVSLAGLAGEEAPPGMAVRVLLEAPAWKRGNAQGIDPIVVHEDRQGNIRFPGTTSSIPPNGYARRELRTIPEALKFEQQYRNLEDNKQQIKVAAEAEQFARASRTSRSDLKQAMKTMSPRGRAFASATMRDMDKRAVERAAKSKRSSDFKIQVLHQDRSSREPWVDQTTGWKRGRD